MRDDDEKATMGVSGESMDAIIKQLHLMLFDACLMETSLGLLSVLAVRCCQ